MIKTGFQKVLRAFYGPMKYVEETKTLLDAGDLESARQLANLGKARYGKWASINLIHARIHVALKKWPDVRDSLARIAENDLARFEFVVEAAEIYQTIKDDERAIELLTRLGDRTDGWRAGVAFNTIGHIYFRNDRPRDSIFAFCEAVSRGGRISWATLNQVLDVCDSQSISDCKQRMEERIVVEDRNAYFYKMLSLLESYLGNDELMLDRIQTAAAKRFKTTYPDVPWVDTNDPLPPTFLVMGAMKCGTTSLFEQIENHPLCLTAMDKELQFFQHKTLKNQWYLNHFPRVSEFPGFVSGDASPGYYAFDIVDRVKELCPDIRLLFIQRDPAKRAISHLRHNNRYGITNSGVRAILRNIDELEDELLRSPEKAEQVILEMCYGIRPDNSYLSMGCYEILLRRWRRAFPADQLMVIELDDYKANPQGTMNNVFEFIGLDPIEIQIKKLNEGHYIKTDPETLRVMERLEQFYSVVDGLKVPLSALK